MIGATSGLEADRASSNFSVGIGAEDEADPTDANRTVAGTRCCMQPQTTGGTAGENSLKSFNATGFTLYQNVADTDAMLNPYLAFGQKGNLQIAVSDTWQEVQQVQIVKSGAWKEVSDIDIAVGAAWKNM